MSLEAARGFRDKINGSSELQGAVAQCWKIEQTIALGQSHGYEFNAEEALSVVDMATENGELSDFELEMVAGGLPTCCVNCDQNGPS